MKRRRRLPETWEPATPRLPSDDGSNQPTGTGEGERERGQIARAQDLEKFSGFFVMIIRLMGLARVMDRIIPICKRMGLAIEGREMELLAFLASLEANKKKGGHVGNQSNVEEVVREDDVI